MKEIVLGTLCWFWDDDEEERVIGQYGGAGAIYFGQDGYTNTHYNMDAKQDYIHCRPVKRDEILLEGDE